MNLALFKILGRERFPGELTQEDMDSIKIYSDDIIRNWHKKVQNKVPNWRKIPLESIPEILELGNEDSERIKKKLSEMYPDKKCFTFKEFMDLRPHSLAYNLLGRKAESMN